MIVYTIELLFTSYTVLIIIRLVGSWFPNFAHTRFMRFIAHYTDPYLNIFRKLIPPIGGALDLSPILAFIVLQVAERLILTLLL